METNRVKTYQITTVDGVIIRAKATRPYRAAWVGRDANGIVVEKSASEFTIKPKLPIGTANFASPRIGTDYGVEKWVYEKVIAIEKK